MADVGGLVILVVMVPLALVAVVLERRDHTLAVVPVMLGLVAHVGLMHGVLAFNSRENELFVVYSAMVGLCLLLGVNGLIDFARSVEQPQQTRVIRLASV